MTETSPYRTLWIIHCWWQQVICSYMYIIYCPILKVTRLQIGEAHLYIILPQSTLCDAFIIELTYEYSCVVPIHIMFSSLSNHYIRLTSNSINDTITGLICIHKTVSPRLEYSFGSQLAFHTQIVPHYILCAMYHFLK